MSRTAKIIAVKYISDMQTSFNIRKKLAILSLFGPKGIKQLINFYYKQSKDNHKLKAKRNLDSSILLALNEILPY